MKHIIDLIHERLNFTSESVSLNERLNLNKDSKISKQKIDIDIEKLRKKADKFCKEGDLPKGMWANGKQLDTLSKMAKNIFGDIVIRINVPYSNFNCYGPANKIYEDVYGQMPFSKKSKSIKTVTTLFYGTTPVDAGNFLPFLAFSDCFYVKSGSIINGVPTFELKRYYESFM
jgi:hypothetical protein